jgi:hypothetical protein
LEHVTELLHTNGKPYQAASPTGTLCISKETHCGGAEKATEGDFCFSSLKSSQKFSVGMSFCTLGKMEEASPKYQYLQESLLMTVTGVKVS